MSLTEFDQEQYDRNRRRDAYLDGRDDGRNEGLFMGKQEDARNALALGLSVDQIARITGLSIEDIRALETEQVTV